MNSVSLRIPNFFRRNSNNIIDSVVGVFKKNNKPTADRIVLMQMVENSKKVMEEYGTLFKSKTLETLYQPEYHYKGMLPRTTYIIDKKTGQKKKMIITKFKLHGLQEELDERYTGRTLGLKNLGYKMFGTRDVAGNPTIRYGVMRSYNNNRYAGTQIRLTQVEVERAMQLHQDSIPLVSLPEALPFHTMMGFRPIEKNTRVRTVAEVKQIIKRLKKSCCMNKENMTPIVHHKDGEFYVDENQTVANALLRHFKTLKDKGVERNFHSEIPANNVDMELRGKELEAWKQRAISQPILLNKSECVKKSWLI